MYVTLTAQSLEPCCLIRSNPHILYLVRVCVSEDKHGHSLFSLTGMGQGVSQPPRIQVTVTPADSRMTTASPGGGRKQGPCPSSWRLQTGCEHSGSLSGPGSRLLSQGLALQDPLSLGLVLLAESVTWCSPALKQHGSTTFLTGHAGGKRHSAHFTGGRWRLRLKSKWYLSL